MNAAYRKVCANKGAGGVDDVTVDELGDYIRENWESIREQIRRREYKPQPVRRVEIAKQNGGVRKFGIATEMNRVIQQGGNLSPPLSNIMLNGLDKELEARGLRFTRYADDCVIAVKSESSAKRVMRTVSDWI